jgi:hypothetical protein
MNDYFYKKFPGQLRGLEYQRPNQVVIEHIMRDNAVVFFGGQHWDNVSNDLAAIPPEDRPRFILSLFMVILTDQCLYTYYKDSYKLWREKTQFPKFGWSGFGPHNENPFMVLYIPERKKVVDTNKVIELLPEFVKFFVEETKNYFKANLPDVNTTEFFNKIKNDSSFISINKGTIVKSFKEKFEALLAN